MPANESIPSVEERLKKAKADTIWVIDEARPFFSFISFLLASAAVVAAFIFVTKQVFAGKHVIINAIAMFVIFALFLKCLDKIWNIIRWGSLMYTIKWSARLGLYEKIQRKQVDFFVRAFISVELLLLVLFYFIVIQIVLSVAPVPHG